MTVSDRLSIIRKEIKRIDSQSIDYHDYRTWAAYYYLHYEYNIVCADSHETNLLAAFNDLNESIIMNTELINKLYCE